MVPLSRNVQRMTVDFGDVDQFIVRQYLSRFQIVMFSAAGRSYHMPVVDQGSTALIEAFAVAVEFDLKQECL